MTANDLPRAAALLAHLWEVDHPYYAAEGSFHARGYHVHYDSFADFLSNEGDSDPDLNFVYRWDWRKPGFPLGQDDTWTSEHLLIFFVSQRKGFCRSVEMPVTEADEDAVRAWLTERGRTVAAIWEPIALTQRGPSSVAVGGHPATGKAATELGTPPPSVTTKEPGATA